MIIMELVDPLLYLSTTLILDLGKLTTPNNLRPSVFAAQIKLLNNNPGFLLYIP